MLTNDAMSPLFEAVIEATEEAIYNSLFLAKTTTGNGHTVEALPIEKTLEILREHTLILNAKYLTWVDRGQDAVHTVAQRVSLYWRINDEPVAEVQRYRRPGRGDAR